jgi:HlyD family secretion protein
VFVVDGGRAVKRAISTSRRNGVEALVEEGLQAGETVVVYPSDALRDGNRVSVVGRNAR